MKRRGTRGKTRKCRNNSDISTRNYQSEFESFTLEIFQNHVSRVAKFVRKSLEMKNNVIKELQMINNQVKAELEDCKLNMKKRDDQMKELDIEKEEFKKITFAEVEKFDETYQSKIDNLEVEKLEMINIISNQENMLRDYEECQEIMKSNPETKNIQEDVKIVKLVKKLKGKVKARDFKIFQNEQQKRDLRKHIESKDKLIKMKDIEILDFDKKLNEEHSKVFSLKTMNSRNKDIEENLNIKDIEIGQLKLKIKNDEDFTAIKIKKMEIEKEHVLGEMKTRNKHLMIKQKDVLNEEYKDLMKKQNNVLNEEYKKLEIQLVEKKEELFKMKLARDSEIKKIKSEQVYSLQTMNSRNKELEEKLNMKDIEITKFKVKSKNDEEKIEKTVIENDQVLGEMKTRNKKVIDLMIKQNDVLNEEYKKLELQLSAKDEELFKMRTARDSEMIKIQSEQMSLDVLNEEYKKLDLQLAEKDAELFKMRTAIDSEMEKIKSERISMNGLKEGLRTQFQETFAKKNDKIKELEELNNLICKDLKDLKDVIVDMKKQQEFDRNSLESKDQEISKLKRIISKLRIRTLEENKSVMAEHYSEKRLTGIKKALKHNTRLEKEVAMASQRKQWLTLTLDGNESGANRIGEKLKDEANQMSKQLKDNNLSEFSFEPIIVDT